MANCRTLVTIGKAVSLAAMMGAYCGAVRDAVAAPYAYVASDYLAPYAPAVSVVDTATNGVIAVLTSGIGGCPHDLAIDPGGTRVYVNDTCSTLVSVIDTACNRVTSTFDVGGYGGNSIVSAPDGAQLYLTLAYPSIYPATLGLVDLTASPPTVFPVSVGDLPLGIAVSPDGSLIYTANHVPGTVSVVDTATKTVVDTWGAWGNSWGIGVNASGTRVYVGAFRGPGDANGAVTVLDAMSGAILATVPIVGGEPNYNGGTLLTANPSGTRVYVSLEFAGIVAVIDTEPGSPTENTVIDTLVLGDLPYTKGVAIDPSGARLYLAGTWYSEDPPVGGLVPIDVTSEPIVELPRIVTRPAVWTTDGFVGPADQAPPTCGNGTMDAACEQCDLGAGNSPPEECRFPGCTSDCQKTGTCSGAGTCCITTAECPAGQGCCGNGIVEADEECDDGNTADGDACKSDCTPNVCGDGIVYVGIEQCDGGVCCSPSCAFEPSMTVCRAAAGPCDVAERCTGASAACPADGFAPPGTPCPADADPCTADVCNGANSCTHEVPVVAGCSPALAGKASLGLKKHPLTDDLDTAKWKWTSGPAFDVAELGAPSATTELALCVLDATRPLLSIRAPAGGTCAGKPCWQVDAIRGKVKYTDKEGTPDGVNKLQGKSGPAGKGRLALKGKGAGLAMPTLGLVLPVRARLVRSDGPGCWEATFSTEMNVRKNDQAQFRAKSD
jgi:cysteine-rich repeat protein/YVTN family beta-propeller protein